MPDVGVFVPKDDALAELLTGSGGVFERTINALANGARTKGGTSSGHVFAGGDVAGVVDDLTALLARARSEGHVAAEGVADVLRQLGVDVAEPEPPAEPEPAP
jgi:hypothetical protein